ncbi:WD40 repeat domain-containing protein [Candidatus Reidiella endopervernicosa]|uniref:WD40 repeat domain-containing protein n=1 Tax=Candidatus Reidiella endopervernicosa TaxID=2738883 RepID=UPI003B967F47
MGRFSRIYHDSRLSPDGNLLATSGEDRSVSLWDVSDGQLITRLDHHSGSVNEISFLQMESGCCRPAQTVVSAFGIYQKSPACQSA